MIEVAVLCCAVLCCAVLCCAVLCCAVLCCLSMLCSRVNCERGCQDYVDFKRCAAWCMNTICILQRSACMQAFVQQCSLQSHLEEGHQEGRQLDVRCFGLPGLVNVVLEG